MSLPDPNSITISGATTPLPRTHVDGDEARYTSADGLIQLRADHDYKSGKRIRRLIRLDVSKITADPFDTSQNVKVGMSVHTVFDLPAAGFTNAEALAIWVGFNTNLTASSNSAISKLLGGES